MFSCRSLISILLPAIFISLLLDGSVPTIIYSSCILLVKPTTLTFHLIKLQLGAEKLRMCAGKNKLKLHFVFVVFPPRSLIWLLDIHAFCRICRLYNCQTESNTFTSAHFVICMAICTFIRQTEATFSMSSYSTWAVSSSRNDRDCISHVTCVEMSSESTGLTRICCPTVGVPVYTWILSMYTHTRQCQRKSTYNRRGRVLSFLFISFFPSLSPSVLF